MDETLIAFGGAVKATGDGRISGRLIRYSTTEDADLEGEYFTKSTDFGLEFPAKVGVYYNHGQDPQMGKKRIGRAEVKADDEGLFLETQLDLSDRYQAAVYKLAQAGRLGASSGAAAHLVEKEKGEKATEITAWPVAEASLTVTPAEPRNVVIALKSVAFPTLEDAAKCCGCGLAYSSYEENMPADATMAAVERMNSSLYYGTVSQAIRDNVTPLPDRLTALRQAFDGHRDLALRVIEAILGESGDEDAAKALLSIKALWGPSDSANGVGPAPSLTLIQNFETVVSAVEELDRRLEGRVAFRQAREPATETKSGRMLSAANLEWLDEVIDRLLTLRKKATAKEADTAQAAEPEVKTLSLRLESLRLQSRLLQEQYAGVTQ